MKNEVTRIRLVGDEVDALEVTGVGQLLALAHVVAATTKARGSSALARGAMRLLSQDPAPHVGPSVHGQGVFLGDECTGWKSPEEARQLAAALLHAADAAARNKNH